jgi:DNA polymerase sigma
MKIVNMNGISDARGKKNRILVLIVIPEQLAHLINLNYNRPLSTKKYTFAKSVGFMESDKVDSSDRTELEDSSPRKDTKGKDKSDESGSGKMMISQMSSPYLHRRKVDVGDVESSDDVLTEAGHKRVDKLEEWLSGNIAEFINFIQTYSTSGDREKRWAIIRYIQRQTSIFLGHASSQHPSQVAIPFGSFTYGMYLPWASDLDMVITEDAFLEDPEIMMNRLAAHFSMQKNHCIQAPPVVVSKTRVPFVQLLLAPPHHARGLIDQANCGLCRMGYSNLCPSHSPISVQLSLSVKEHAGLVSTASVNYLVAHYPVIRGIVLVLKHILVSENLNSPFEGGLSSHSLIILVTAFVRHFHPHDHNIALPGNILLQLLCWYAGIQDGHHKVFALINEEKTMCSSFDPATMAVDIKADSDCFRLKSSIAEQSAMLYVVDPLDASHNAARSMWRWIDLKTTLTNAYWHVYSGKWWNAMGAGSPAHSSTISTGGC